jgi:hypothetical protein
MVSVSCCCKGRAALSFELRTLSPFGVCFSFYSRAVGYLRWLTDLVRTATGSYGYCHLLYLRPQLNSTGTMRDVDRRRTIEGDRTLRATWGLLCPCEKRESGKAMGTRPSIFGCPSMFGCCWSCSLSFGVPTPQKQGHIYPGSGGQNTTTLTLKVNNNINRGFLVLK